MESLGLHIWTECSSDVPPSYTSDDGIDNILIEFIDHPSIKTIKQNFNITSKCLFEPVLVNNVKEVIKDLKSNKSVSGGIATKSWKNVILHFLHRPIALINLLKMTHFLTTWKKLLSFQFLKRTIPLTKKTTGQLVHFFRFSLRSLKN